MKKKVSIYDIAKYCNISPTSVSYVINGKEKVSEKTKQKVLNAIKELSFVPDNTARSLSIGKSHLIGLLLPLEDNSTAFLQNPFYVEFIGGLEQEFSESDYDIVIACIKNKQKLRNWIKSRGIDGLIMIGVNPDTIYEEIKGLNIPIVLTDVYDKYKDEFFNVRIDDKKGMYYATKHLIENGHKKIGFAGSKDYSLVDMNRFNGYKEALTEYGLEFNDGYEFKTFARFDDGYKIAEEILKRDNITGLVCSSDIVAIGIIKRYLELEYDMPDALSIVGFDDIMDAKYIYPGLTTIRQDINLKGKIAGKLIIENMQEKSSDSYSSILEPKLIVRESVKKIN